MFLTKIDDNGLYVEPAILDSIPPLTEDKPVEITDDEGNTTTVTQTVPVLDNDGNPIPNPHYIVEPCPSEFYWPKWDGVLNKETYSWNAEAKWVEGGKAPESVVQTPTQDERLSAIEAAMKVIMGVG